MPVPVALAAPMSPVVVPPNVMRHLENMPSLIGVPAKIVGTALNQSAEGVPASSPGRDIEIKKDESGKYVATTQMDFVAKAQPGKPFVIRNILGRIVLRPSKDGTSNVRAVIRGKAETSAEARAKT